MRDHDSACLWGLSHRNGKMGWASKLSDDDSLKILRQVGYRCLGVERVIDFCLGIEVQAMI